MSISMRSTKAQMYSEIERLRALCDLQSQQLGTPRPAPSTKQSLAQFCSAYCATHGTRSVPGHVVKEWRAQQ